jgi:hypothetical protein
VRDSIGIALDVLKASWGVTLDQFARARCVHELPTIRGFLFHGPFHPEKERDLALIGG